jgi:hypothetical protein
VAYYDVSNRDNKEDGDHIGVKKADLTKVSNQNYFVLEHQYGGYDVTCKPFVSHKSISIPYWLMTSSLEKGWGVNVICSGFVSRFVSRFVYVRGRDPSECEERYLNCSHFLMWDVNIIVA